MTRRPEDAYVLVVDDEQDVVNYLAALLEDAGFEVAKALNGDDALAIVKERAPDLISLDLVMPGKSGTRFLYALRRDKNWSRIPVLIVTGHAHDELGKGDLADILAGKVISGPAVYLEKPVSPEGYVSAVKRQLGMETVLRTAPAGQAMRSEVKRLLADADPETLGNILKLLKSGASGVPVSEPPAASLGRVLVIDDEPDVAAYLAAFLSDCGYATDVATDPNEGISKAKASPPDVITLDVDMPGKTGVEVYQELRADDSLADVKVVVITAVPQKLAEHPGGKEMMGEIEGYLTKPFEPEVLRDTVAQALAR
jgi:two-component system alkaline phosphatase synthesis response regulator PhoP